MPGGHTFTKFTLQKKGKFLAELRRHGNATRASKAIGLSRVAVYIHRRADATFAEAWDNARAEYAEEVLEVEADRRAIEGVHHRTYFDKDGKPIGEERRYSDTLLIFRLKALKPQEYKERYEIGGDQENPLRIEDAHARQARIDDLIMKRNGHEVEAG